MMLSSTIIILDDDGRITVIRQIDRQTLIRSPPPSTDLNQFKDRGGF